MHIYFVQLGYASSTNMWCSTYLFMLHTKRLKGLFLSLPPNRLYILPWADGSLNNSSARGSLQSPSRAVGTSVCVECQCTLVVPSQRWTYRLVRAKPLGRVETIFSCHFRSRVLESRISRWHCADMKCDDIDQCTWHIWRWAFRL
jgi:hypothetical protein